MKNAVIIVLISLLACHATPLDDSIERLRQNAIAVVMERNIYAGITEGDGWKVTITHDKFLDRWHVKGKNNDGRSISADLPNPLPPAPADREKP